MKHANHCQPHQRRSIGRRVLDTIFLAAPIAVLLAPAAAHATRYVSSVGIDEINPKGLVNDCTDVNMPCRTLTHAISLALVNEAIALEGGPFQICNVIVNKSLTIRGRLARVTLDGNNGCRHFDVSTAQPASVTFSNLQFVDGFATHGGSIRIGTQGEVSIRGVEFARNEATFGGAIHNSGELHVLSDASFQDNDAGFGGAIYNVGGWLDANDTAFSGNEASTSGGAIYGTTGSIEISDSSFGLNTARGNGGAIDTSATELSVAKTTFLWNLAETGYGGAISNGEGSDLKLEDSSVLWGVAGQSGGGISNSQGSVTVLRSAINLNTAQNHGGAIANLHAGELVVRDTTLSYNAAENNGGGIYDDTLAATSTALRRSTFTSNHARNGGGVYFRGAANSELIVTNSTYSENEADFGAAIFSTGAGRAAIANATLYGQVLGQTGGGALFNDSAQRLGLNNSIITATTNAAGGGPGIDCFVPGFINGRHNLSDNCGSGAPFNLGPVTALDAVLQDNGGETHTHRLLTGSNAIDQGFNNCPAPDTLAPLANDQRTVTRPQDGDLDAVALCDIGAYEFYSLVPTSSIPNPNLP